MGSRTEFIWDGKYKNGKKVLPVKIDISFQAIGSLIEEIEVA